MHLIVKPFCLLLILGGLAFAPCTAGGEEEANTLKAAPPTGRKIALRMNLPKGTRRKAAMETNMEMKVVVGEETAKIKTRMGMEYFFAIEDVDADGAYTVKMTNDRMTMKLASGSTKFDYDSAKQQQEDHLAARVLGKFLGKSIVVNMNAQREVTKLTGFDDLATEIAKDLPQSEAQIRERLRETQHMIAPFSHEAVDNGDTWTAAKKIGGVLPMTFDTTYTLLERKEGEAIIGICVEISGALQGEMHGTMNIDIASGWTNSAKMTMRAGGKTSTGMIDVEALMTMKPEL